MSSQDLSLLAAMTRAYVRARTIRRQRALRYVTAFGCIQLVYLLSLDSSQSTVQIAKQRCGMEIEPLPHI